jgi:putative membrane protein
VTRVRDDDGDVVWETHPSALGLVAPALALPLVIGVATYLAVRAGTGAAAGPVLAAVAVGALLALLVLVVRPLLAWAGALLVLTPSRLGLRRGVLARSERDLPLARIAEVRTEQTARQRLVRIGTLIVVPAGGGEPLVAEAVPRVRQVQALVVDLAEEAGAGSDDEDEDDEGETEVESDDGEEDGEAPSYG